MRTKNEKIIEASVLEAAYEILSSDCPFFFFHSKNQNTYIFQDWVRRRRSQALDPQNKPPHTCSSKIEAINFTPQRKMKR